MKKKLLLAVIGSLAITSQIAFAGPGKSNNGDKEDIKNELEASCTAIGLGDSDAIHAALETALIAAQGEANGGFGLPMWATIVNRDGGVCAVARSHNLGEQWPGSRVISAQKANTANAFSLPGLALSTANLFSATQPGGSLFGLQFSNPVDAEEAYAGLPSNYGTDNDPMVGERIGGVNVFGGGLALYSVPGGTLVGAVGVSGDSSCADHNIAWRVRDNLGLDQVPAGVSATGDDNIVFDITADPAGGTGVSASGWGHAACGPDVQTANDAVLIDAPLTPNP